MRNSIHPAWPHTFKSAAEYCCRFITSENIWCGNLWMHKNRLVLSHFKNCLETERDRSMLLLLTQTLCLLYRHEKETSFSNLKAIPCHFKLKGSSVIFRGSGCTNGKRTFNLTLINFSVNSDFINGAPNVSFEPKNATVILLSRNVVAVSDTYRDDISDGHSIWDRIYSGQHHILG